jgi:demethylmenaquinone methyltransferase/2-methoxy-6-polyprenyl-1,4-benzoquinol methylase
MVERRSKKIQEMFGAIAHRYDFLNHFLSLSIDRRWRRLTRRKLTPFLDGDSVLLDLCTGTGDLAIEMSSVTRVIGCDFCHPMLVHGTEKVRKLTPPDRIPFVEGDALCLPFKSAGFDALTIAFGLRNLEDYRAGIREMNRVLRPQGVLAILEFSQPTLPVFRNLYGFYFNRILPRLGKLISGVKGPYSYLPESVGDFPTPEGLGTLLSELGFAGVRYFRLTGGVAALHLGQKTGPKEDGNTGD